MAFETRPFNLGNTLAQAAQIQSLRNRNTLNDTLLSERNAVAEALQNDMPLNELARLNPTGLNTAMGLNQLEAGIAQLDAVRASSALTRAQIAHRAASGVASSKNPAQAALIALRDPSVAEIFGNIDPTTMDPEILRSEAQSLAEATAFSMDPARLAQLQRGRSAQVQTPQGPAFVTEVFNPATGETSVEQTLIPGTLTNQSGETPAQQTARAVREAEQKERVKMFAAERKRIMDESTQAKSTLTQIQRFRRYSTDVESGSFAPTQANLRRLGLALGFDVNTAALAAAEGIQALAVPFTLQIAQQTKGPISDREMALFASAVPGLSRSPGGNGIILEFMERVAKRSVDINQLASRWISSGRELDENWVQSLYEWEQENPLFDNTELEVLENAAFETGGAMDLGDGATLTPIP